MKNLYIAIIMLIGISRVALAQSKPVPKELQFGSENNAKSGRASKRTGETEADRMVPSKSKKEIKGDKLFFIYDYAGAIKNYNSAESLTADGRRNVAKSYSCMHKNDLCKEAYSNLLKFPQNAIPEDYYNYAMVLRSDGDYQQSEKWMNEFAALKPDELRTKSYLENRAALNDLLTDKEIYTITRLDLNTDAQDFAPAFYKNKIVFASSRTTKLFPKTCNRTGKPYLNIYMADLKQKQMQDPGAFDESLNGKMNEGTASFSKDGTLMAFTENNYNLTKKDLVVNMEIYFMTYDKGKWSKPVPFAVNNKAYSVGHPSLSGDGKTMYFSSDMPGGFGGADIYKVTKTKNDEWSEPKNLGACINTEGDEVFPFYDDNNNIIYFASNGHYGLGGLDLFLSPLRDTDFVQAVNMGAPLNTTADDFSLIIDSLGTTGYFASNRPGGAGDDDIYRVDFLGPKKIEGIAMDTAGHPLPTTFITLQNENNTRVDTFTTGSDGAFTFTVETKKNYLLTGKKETYTDGHTNTNTFGPERIIKANVILPMPPKAEEVVKATEKPNTERKVATSGHLPAIYFDFDKYNIRPDAKVVLDQVVKELNENPGMKMRLTAHTDCRGSRAYNQVLSNKRAEASASYLKKRISNPFRISARGYGETQLANGCACEGTVISDCSEEEHQANRRTEFNVLIKD